MLKNKHTPGPWQVCPNAKEYRHASLLVWGTKGPGYGAIAEASNYQYEKEANARLIAAAPELLEALEETAELAHNLANEKVHGEKKFENCDARICIKARAAIAKAKGEQ